MADIVNVDITAAQRERDEKNTKIGYYCNVLNPAIQSLLEVLIQIQDDEKSVSCSGELHDGKILTVTVEVKNGQQKA